MGVENSTQGNFLPCTNRTVGLWWLMREFRPDDLMVDLHSLESIAAACDDGRGWVSGPHHKEIRKWLQSLVEHCRKFGLPVSAIAANRVVDWLDPGGINARDLQSAIMNLVVAVENECQTILFYSIEADRKHYYDEWRDGWQEALARFPALATDVEEMNKCYALGRYAGAVFHAVHADEVALIEVGEFLGVADPKSGWTATANRLDAYFGAS